MRAHACPARQWLRAGMQRERSYGLGFEFARNGSKHTLSFWATFSFPIYVYIQPVERRKHMILKGIFGNPLSCYPTGGHVIPQVCRICQS